MQIVTIKAKPKAVLSVFIFLLALGIVVFTFLSNHSAKTVGAKAQNVSCKSADERLEYLKSLGWETDGKESARQIIIPEKFNDVYESYNSIQKTQGFNLEEYKGKSAVIYTYKITNYKDNKNVIADLIVFGDKLIAADLCDPAADNGFLKELEENGKT